MDSEAAAATVVAMASAEMISSGRRHRRNEQSVVSQSRSRLLLQLRGRCDDGSVDHCVGTIVLDEPFVRGVPFQRLVKADGHVAQQARRRDVVPDVGRLPGWLTGLRAVEEVTFLARVTWAGRCGYLAFIARRRAMYPAGNACLDSYDRLERREGMQSSGLAVGPPDLFRGSATR